MAWFLFYPACLTLGTHADPFSLLFVGNDTGDEPEENGSGPSEWCIYDDSDVTEIN